MGSPAAEREAAVGKSFGPAVRRAGRLESVRPQQGDRVFREVAVDAYVGCLGGAIGGYARPTVDGQLPLPPPLPHCHDPSWQTTNWPVCGDLEPALRQRDVNRIAVANISISEARRAQRRPRTREQAPGTTTRASQLKCCPRRQALSLWSQASGKRPTNARQQRVKSGGLGWFRVKVKIHDPLQLLRIVRIRWPRVAGEQRPSNPPVDPRMIAGVPLDHPRDRYRHGQDGRCPSADTPLANNG